MERGAGVNPVIETCGRIVEGFNRLPLWRSDCDVWGQRMRAETFDRWLYLRLHKVGLMGRAERAAIARLVRPGMTVVEVGSNLGLYTVLLSRLVGPEGRVVAFEPDPTLAPLVVRSGAANGCGNIAVRAQALGRERGRQMLHTLAINSGDNHLSAGGGRWLRRSVEVEVVALDEVAPQLVPDLVKIDVQGWELEVLRGMERLIERCPRVTVYFEYWPTGLRRAGDSPEALAAFFTERGFTIFEVDTLKPLDGRGLAELPGRVAGLKYVELVACRQTLPQPTR
jgi:FkbM family methyltransferase